MHPLERVEEEWKANISSIAITPEVSKNLYCRSAIQAHAAAAMGHELSQVQRKQANELLLKDQKYGAYQDRWIPKFF